MLAKDKGPLQLRYPYTPKLVICQTFQILLRSLVLKKFHEINTCNQNLSVGCKEKYINKLCDRLTHSLIIKQLCLVAVLSVLCLYIDDFSLNTVEA